MRVIGAPPSLLSGERTSSDGKPVSNHILLAIPDNEFQLIRPFLHSVDLPPHVSLHEPGETIEFAYFLNRGLISVVVATREGKTVEVGVVGKEGIVGTPAIFGLKLSPHRAVMQISGDAFQVPVDFLLSSLGSLMQLQLLACRHAMVQGMQAAQSAACNRLHGIEQRLARWLLLVQDRVDNGLLKITHDFLATMLGTDRPSVSLAAGELQRKGTIGYSRGEVRIENRKKLEELACECYSVMQQFNGSLGLR